VGLERDDEMDLQQAWREMTDLRRAWGEMTI
jgi:hypothetical protein